MEKYKILFVHNSLPEYRVGWFHKLSGYADCRFLITNPQIAGKIYGHTGEKNGLNCIELRKGFGGYIDLVACIKENKDVNFIELPPIDSLNEYMKSLVILYFANKWKIKTGYFWEKWDAPKKLQPVSRRVKNKILSITANSLYRQCDVIFAVGEKSKDYFKSNGVPDEKIHIIPDSTYLPKCKYESIRKNLDIPESNILLLYFGRIIKQKGLDVLIRAISKLELEQKNRVSLVVAGDGPFKNACVELAETLSLKNVCFTGSVDPKIRRNYFEQCDIFIHPGTFYKGRTDVWGLTLNEAVDCGKIIIATEAVGSAYELVRRENGIIVEAGNTIELTKAIHDVIVNFENMKRTAMKKDIELSTKYSTDNMAKEYINVLDLIFG